MEKLEQLFDFLGLPRGPSPEAITETMQRAKTKAQEERLLPRLPMTFTPPLVLMENLIALRMKWDKRQSDWEYTRQTYLGNDIYFSSTPLSSLKPGKSEYQVLDDL
jgi:hypothetical protein